MLGIKIQENYTKHLEMSDGKETDNLLVTK